MNLTRKATNLRRTTPSRKRLHRIRNSSVGSSKRNHRPLQNGPLRNNGTQVYLVIELSRTRATFNLRTNRVLSVDGNVTSKGNHITIAMRVSRLTTTFTRRVRHSLFVSMLCQHTISLLTPPHQRSTHIVTNRRNFRNLGSNLIQVSLPFFPHLSDLNNTSHVIRPVL